MRELLQYLGHERRGDAVLLGDLAGATGVLLAVYGQVLDGNQPIIGFLGKLKHQFRMPSRFSMNMRLNQSHIHYIPYRTPKSTRTFAHLTNKPCISFSL